MNVLRKLKRILRMLKSSTMKILFSCSCSLEPIEILDD